MNNGVLDVTGTVNDDRFDVSRNGNKLTVSFNGRTLGTFHSKTVRSIRVAGNAGDDVLSVGGGVDTPVLFDDGPGEDHFLGERDNDDEV